MNREEPECIKRWKVEQEEMLKQKDADEEVIGNIAKSLPRHCLTVAGGSWLSRWKRHFLKADGGD